MEEKATLETSDHLDLMKRKWFLCKLSKPLRKICKERTMGTKWDWEKKKKKFLKKMLKGRGKSQNSDFLKYFHHLLQPLASPLPNPHLYTAPVCVWLSQNFGKFHLCSQIASASPELHVWMNWSAQEPHPAPVQVSRRLHAFLFPKAINKPFFYQILLGVGPKGRLRYGPGCNIAIAQQGGSSPR